MTNRFFTANTAWLSSDEIVQYMVYNNWEFINTIPLLYLTDVPSAEALVASWDVFFDAGVPIWLGIEVPMNPPSPYEINGVRDYDAVAADYEEEFGACMDVYDASEIVGYLSELAHDESVVWLNSRKVSSGKLFSQHWYWDITQPENNWDWMNVQIHNDPDWRIQHVDEIIIEVYSMYDAEVAARSAKYIHENYPDMPLGVITSIAGPLNGTWWWGSLDILTQKLNCASALAKIKINAGYKLDIIEDMPIYNSGETVQEQGDFISGLYATELGTKHVSLSNQNGITPPYSGAAPYCSRDPQPDTFVNAGNELILLKNYGVDCAAHEITITSTDTLTHKDYTLTCLPERGTFIGPYPLEDYGALPTIEYDNTNLYVSVLKVEPTA